MQLLILVALTICVIIFFLPNGALYVLPILWRIGCDLHCQLSYFPEISQSICFLLGTIWALYSGSPGGFNFTQLVFQKLERFALSLF